MAQKKPTPTNFQDSREKIKPKEGIDCQIATTLVWFQENVREFFYV